MSLARTVAKTTGALVVARVVVIGAGIGAVALASRYLGLAGYGALTTAMAFTAIFAVLCDFGLSTVAVREIARAPERRREILGSLLVTGLGCAAAAAALAAIVLFAAYPDPGDAPVREAVGLLAVQLLCAPVVAVARAHLTAEQRGWLLAAGDVALAGAMVGFSAIAVILDLGYLALVGAVATGYVAQALVMGFYAGRDGAIRFAHDRVVSRQLLRLALPLGGTLLVNYLYFRLDVLLLSWLRSDEDVGLYGLAYRVVEALMVLPSFVMLALFPEIARHSENRARLRQLVTPALAAMQAFAIPVAGLTAIFATQIVAVVGGDGYEGAVAPLRILMLALAISYLNGVYGNALLALGRQGRLFWLSLVVLGANIALNLALIPAYGVTGAAWAVTASEVLSYFVVRWLYREAAGTLGPTASGKVGLAGLGLLPALGLELLLDGHVHDLVVVTVGGGAGVLCYFALLIHFKAVPELAAVRALLSRRQAGA